MLAIYKHTHESRGHFIPLRVFILMEGNSPSVLHSIFSDSDSEENVCSDVCGILSVGKDNEVSGHTASCSVSPVLSSSFYFIAIVFIKLEIISYI